MATVVCVLVDTLEVSSTPTLAEVMAASVVSGSISEIEPTNVVLPTPNPPEITILTGCSDSSLDGLLRPSEVSNAMEHPFEKRLVRAFGRALVDVHQALLAHVGDEDAGHAERDPEVGRHLGHRD